MAIIRLLSWNVNGLRAVHKKGFVEWFLGEGPDILCLQETKATVDQLPPEVSTVEGYESHFSRSERKGYSGVGVYTKTAPDRVTYEIGAERFDREGRVIVADYRDFTLITTYFPNGRSSAERLQYKLDFYDAFLTFIDDLTASGKAVVLCGDVNTAHKPIDLARPKENVTVSGFLPVERQWIDRVLDHGYVDIFRKFDDRPDQYTYWDMMSRARDRNVGWRIDYFFVGPSVAPRVKAAYILPDVMGSDHCPVGIDLEVGS